VSKQVSMDQLVAQSSGGILLYSVLIFAVAIFLGFFLAKRKGVKRFHWWPLLAAVPIIAGMVVLELASLGNHLQQTFREVEQNG
jgi:hypothetical protein